MQDSLIGQAPVNKQQSDSPGKTALQDLLIVQPCVMVGLIAQSTGSALQDDIALAARRMQHLGNEILYPQPKGAQHGKTFVVPNAAAPIAPQFSWIAQRLVREQHIERLLLIIK
ncbi:MAG: hypothetical protein AB1641_01700 [Thermodesulfobacteriota bacterium]